MEKITCFIPFGTEADTAATVQELKAGGSVHAVVVLKNNAGNWIAPAGSTVLETGSLQETATIKAIADTTDTEYTLLYTQTLPLQVGAYALDRMVQVAEATGAGLVYADSYKIKNGVRQIHPVIDYQVGSLRDDFDFGSVLLYKTSVLKAAATRMGDDYQFAALYDLRLKASQGNIFLRLPEYLYTELETDDRKSGEKIFDYVDPKNRRVQVEMEHACTEHLKDVGAWLMPEFKEVEFSTDQFPVEASVVIPVYNRVKTIEDAVRSVLIQQTDFAFNLIVVDNHSTDGTTEILKKIAAQDKRLLHVIPQRKDLGIGGCWNEAVMHPQCGKFAIQLDSDDLYIDEQVVKSMVTAFYEQNCAMVVGTYRMVNFKLEEIPPGVIDHREWTPDNGRNNALRINGLGAPRAFYTPVLREIKIPNTNYGEDYAIGLAISHTYQIGRIYEPLYLCRRWDDNSDASLDIVKTNANNLYKDRIRTIEFLARVRQNQ